MQILTLELSKREMKIFVLAFWQKQLKSHLSLIPPLREIVIFAKVNNLENHIKAIIFPYENEIWHFREIFSRNFAFLQKL